MSENFVKNTNDYGEVGETIIARIIEIVIVESNCSIRTPSFRTWLRQQPVQKL